MEFLPECGEADCEGVITQAINGGLIVNYQSGARETLTDQVGDLIQFEQWQVVLDERLDTGFDATPDFVGSAQPSAT